MVWEPFGTASVNTTAQWKTGPSERGTLNILSTCLITLTLCVYTCLHVDIPEHGKTHWAQILKRKLLWLLPGIFAPEIVAFIALRQWFFARNLELQMKAALDPLLSQSPKDSPLHAASDNQGQLGSRRIHPWTRLHSHYALMGGFAFDTSKLLNNFLPEGRTRLTLTPIALRKLASYEPDLIPDISSEQIREKSKADCFAKSIACLQALWFIMQVIGRLAAKYPISLLEMNTFLHALCCLAIYLAWWNKPLDIEHPTIVDASKEPARKICAWMVMQSALGYLPTYYYSYHGVFGEGLVRAQGSIMLVYEEDALRGYPGYKSYEKAKSELDGLVRFNSRQGRAESVDLNDDGVPLVNTNLSNDGNVKLHTGQKLFGFRFIPVSNHRVPTYGTYAQLSPANVECLRLAQALREEVNSISGWQFGSLKTCRYPNTNMLVACASARSYDPVRRGTDQALNKRERKSLTHIMGTMLGSVGKELQLGDSVDSSYLPMTIASSIYGGVHLLAWNGPFPSIGETIIWRICAGSLAGTFPAIAGSYLLVTLALYLMIIPRKLWCESTRIQTWRQNWAAQTLLPAAPPFWKSWYAERLARYLEFLTKITELEGQLQALILQHVLVCWSGLYCAARVYLVVESFKGLAYLPDKVYQEPEWSHYILHLGAG
ncbi:hypothetical protein BKA66DRAFT_44533 [Pyrenochaeta sp. MPI-SDFR-AT-0127]|nr:hypothetical protein BKA66DRAFT_44533 [Pyrenochaeta sp. MPI-SDFR-AT-0127]